VKVARDREPVLDIRLEPLTWGKTVHASCENCGELLARHYFTQLGDGAGDAYQRVETELALGLVPRGTDRSSGLPQYGSPPTRQGRHYGPRTRPEKWATGASHGLIVKTHQGARDFRAIVHCPKCNARHRHEMAGYLT